MARACSSSKSSSGQTFSSEAQSFFAWLSNVQYVPLEQVAGRMKAVPMDSDTLITGRDIGICFGD